MSQLQQLWERVRGALLDLVRGIEESAAFERLLSEYDALEPRQQKWLRAMAVLLVLGGFVVIVALPVVNVFRTQRNLNDLRALVAEMRHYQDQKAVIRKPAPPPLGFQNLPANSPAEAEESLKAFLASIGLEGDALTTGDNGGWRLVVPELSVRQATTLLFQIDAWTPRLTTENVQVTVHPANKELLTLNADLRYGAMAMNGGFPGLPTGGNRGGNGYPPAGEYPANEGGHPGSGGGTMIRDESMGEDPNGAANGFPAMPPPDAPSNFQSELPPPEFEEDM